MSLVINNNLMAMNAARNLDHHYGDLATSTRRLSSGLRIDTAADDAAGLAIRELMRADIAAMNQGVRNANDGISAIQTADGALEVIDNKLIRMKELAEQAATGTYTSDQRKIIDQEYQQMKSEINRIANATEFNQVKLLDGNLGEDEGNPMKLHFGPRNNDGEDFYYVNMGDATARGIGLEDSFLRLAAEERMENLAGKESELHNIYTKLSDGEPENPEEVMDDVIEARDSMEGLFQDIVEAKKRIEENDEEEWTDEEQDFMDHVESAKESLDAAIEEYEGDDPSWTGDGSIRDHISEALNHNYDRTVDLDDDDFVSGGIYTLQIGDETVTAQSDGTASGTASAFLDEINGLDGYSGVADNGTITITQGAGTDEIQISAEGMLAFESGSTEITDAFGPDEDYESGGEGRLTIKAGDEEHTFSGAVEAGSGSGDMHEFLENVLAGQTESGLGDDNLKFSLEWTGDDEFIIKAEDEDGDPVEITEASYELFSSGDDPDSDDPAFSNSDILGLGQPATNAEISDDLYTLGQNLDKNINETAPTMFAQQALEDIDAAIEKKDRIRADLGAFQNRLESTISNLQIQAENLQAAESRISDADVAYEMTQFMRNQVLSQGATAMLAQANTLPQMAMQLMG
ncbi:MAG: hypothetical protein D5S03_07670 [Desulfonatronospira sp. MSAO_Bac3]|nr:flagellin [Desulfonatronospira sp. MSAO_Bac3]RQD75738.1 MAG: hypothetical protein D5S03_07670 [Desulfonatronospira sp. MSAO_Bac3]